MSKVRPEDYEPEVGGLFDDFESPILNAWFGGPPANYAQNSIGLHIEMDSGGERPVEQFYSCGSPEQWEITRNGQELVKVKNPEKHAFNKNTTAWALVDKILTLVGDGDIKKGQNTMATKTDRYMTEAEFFTTGFNFHWLQQPVKNPVTKEERNVLLPKAFLGEVAAPATATSTAAVDTSALDAIVIGLAEGKTVRELRLAAVNDATLKAPENKAYIKELVSGTKLAELEKAGKLTQGPDDKFV